jgi:hypothetical protein
MNRGRHHLLANGSEGCKVPSRPSPYSRAAGAISSFGASAVPQRFLRGA